MSHEVFTQPWARAWAGELDASAAYDVMPFGLEQAEFTDFATAQFQRRFARIEKARRQSLAEVCGTAEAWP